MASNSRNGTGWSDVEKNTLLLKVVELLQKAGGKLNLAAIDMPGRTPKALNHTLSHCRKEADAMSFAGNAKGKWSEGEKKYLLVKMIDRLQSSGRLDLKEINMPGRTTKSMTHAVQKLKVEAAVFGGHSTTTGPATASKKRSRHEEDAQDESDRSSTDAKKRKVKQ